MDLPSHRQQNSAHREGQHRTYSTVEPSFTEGLKDDSKKAPTSRRTSRRRLLSVVGVGIATGIVSGKTVWGTYSFDSNSTAQRGITVDVPLRREWKVMNPPGHPEFAHDFIGMRTGSQLPYTAASAPQHLINEIPASQAFGWGRPVYAPIDGTIRAVSNDEPDASNLNLFRDGLRTVTSPPAVEGGDIRPAAGNYVVIESAESVAFLAHLRRGSVIVDNGMSVDKGELLGEVGNSGASLFPHLHFQMTSEWTTDLSRMEETLLPFRFSEYERLRGNRLTGRTWESVQNRMPEQGERFRVYEADQ